MPHRHQLHLNIINRLKRATGHLSSIVIMIEEERPCLALAQQLHAVEKAIANARKTLIHDHIDHCLDDVISAKGKINKSSLTEFKDITKYL